VLRDAGRAEPCRPTKVALVPARVWRAVPLFEQPFAVWRLAWMPEGQRLLMSTRAGRLLVRPAALAALFAASLLWVILARKLSRPRLPP
jgi:hypothetical protein